MVNSSHAPNLSPRIAREKRTLSAMVGIYCRAHHRSAGRLCEECAALAAYAICRLDRCPFGAEKTACAQCPVHCYQRAMRARIQVVMRYAGPRMLYRHPILALRHQCDALRSRWRRKSG
jgi:hypothetical protein